MKIGDRVHYDGMPEWVGTITGRSAKFGFVYWRVEFDDYLPKEFATDCKVMWFGAGQLCLLDS